jgi:hypothetical protein
VDFRCYLIMRRDAERVVGHAGEEVDVREVVAVAGGGVGADGEDGEEAVGDEEEARGGDEGVPFGKAVEDGEL